MCTSYKFFRKMFSVFNKVVQKLLQWVYVYSISFLQVLKIRKTIKTLQQFKKQLPYLTAEIIKELEFIASNHQHPDAYKRCKEVKYF